MRLDIRALALAGGVIWGGAVLLIGTAHLIWPAYGTAALELAASIYPGYDVGGLGSVVVGTLYALLDGAIGGAILAWLYNLFIAPEPATSPVGR